MLGKTSNIDLVLYAMKMRGSETLAPMPAFVNSGCLEFCSHPQVIIVKCSNSLPQTKVCVVGTNLSMDVF